METPTSTTGSASSLGEELKRRREQRGITLRHISDETRINMRFLQAIEGDNYRVLPGAVFNRRFVAAVAKQVGMDEEEAVRRYIEQEQSHTEDDSGPYQLPPVNDMSITRDRGKRSRWWIAPVILVLLGIVLYGAWRISPGFRNLLSPITGKTDSDLKPNQPDHPPAPAQSAVSAPTQPQPTVAQDSKVVDNVDNNVLKIDLKVIQDQCWVRTRIDNGSFSDLTLKTGEERNYQPKEKLEISIGESKNIELRINGKLAHFEKSVINKAIITPSTWQQFVSN